MKDFRKTYEQAPVGTNALHHPAFPTPLPILSMWFFINAQQKTKSILDKPDFSHSNIEILNCIGIWFWAMESAISTAFKIVSKKDPQESKWKLPQKFKHLASFLDASVEPPSLLINELNNFCCFRNYLFHDLYYYDKKPEYTYSMFSKLPAYATEVDLIEAIRISINCVYYYREILAGVDLLPKHLEDFYTNEVIPTFAKKLENLNFFPIQFKKLDGAICPIQTKQVFMPIIKY